MGLGNADAREIMEQLSHWRPVDASMGLVREAWQWMDEAQLTYWDALILADAHRCGARYLLSEDFSGGTEVRRRADPESVPAFPG